MAGAAEETTLFGILPRGGDEDGLCAGDGKDVTGSEVLCSGPFTLRRYAQRTSSGLFTRGYVVLFCLNGSVELRLHSFIYRLGSGHVAVVDGRRLAECRCGADTELLEYRPRVRRFAFLGDEEEIAPFTVLPSRARLDAWAQTVARRIREGASFRREPSCAVRVQLRDLSGGTLPFPFSCEAGCPRWDRCAAVAGYGRRSCAPLRVRKELPPQSALRRAVTLVAAVVGIGLWGGLLLYGVWVELSALF